MNIAIFARYVEEERVTYTDKKYTITGAFEPIAERCGFSLIPILPSTDIDTILKVADGIIIPGCRTDVDPKHYNAPLDPHTYNKPYDMYASDIPFIEAFINSGKKVLGICAGLQELNVYFGGTLKQHIEGHNQRGMRHQVTLKEDSCLYKMYGTKQLSVSSTHHQCIDVLAPGVKQIAVSDDGIIEAFEKDNILAVQWHPEAMDDQLIFEKFFGI